MGGSLSGLPFFFCPPSKSLNFQVRSLVLTIRFPGSPIFVGLLLSATLNLMRKESLFPSPKYFSFYMSLKALFSTWDVSLEIPRHSKKKTFFLLRLLVFCALTANFEHSYTFLSVGLTGVAKNWFFLPFLLFARGKHFFLLASVTFAFPSL